MVANFQLTGYLALVCWLFVFVKNKKFLFCTQISVPKQLKLGGGANFKWYEDMLINNEDMLIKLRRTRKDTRSWLNLRKFVRKLQKYDSAAVPIGAEGARNL